MPEERTLRDELTLSLTDMAYGGDAVGRDPGSGVVVFAWPGIEGETVRVRVGEEKRSMLRGVVTQVLVPSPARAEPPCPYFGTCGGCQWQHLNYDAQLRYKHDILRAQLARAGIDNLDTVLIDPVPSPRPFNYRNTSHFANAPAPGQLGYFKRESHSVVPVETCPISDPQINALIPGINQLLLSAAEGPSSHEQRGVMSVTRVSVRASEVTGHILICFHSRSTAGPVKTSRVPGARRPELGPNVDEDPVARPVLRLRRRDVRRATGDLAKQLHAEPGKALSVVELMEDGSVNLLRESGAPAALSDTAADALAGVTLQESFSASHGSSARPPAGAWIERLGAITYWVAPGSFFQANTPVAEALLAEVRAQFDRRVTLLVDAHAGVGTFALALADLAVRVIGFETDRAAVVSARWTAAAHNMSNVEFSAGRAEVLLPKLAPHEKPEVVVLDPPRAGCHPALLAEVSRRGTAKIIYVSCDPSTLARDLKTLAPDYTLSYARLFDMFPQTYHIETLAVLDRTTA